MTTHWPFKTQAERDAYDAMQRQGSAVLRAAHELFMAAINAKRES